MHEIFAIFIPRDQIANQIISMKFGIVFGYLDNKYEVISWDSLKNVEYKVIFYIFY